MKWQIFRICFIIFFLNPNVDFTQQLPVNLHFNKFTTDNGLSDNHVGQILKDKKGYLWIVTQNAVDRFDGVEFKAFLHNPSDSNSLLSNYVSSIAEDSLGRIWAATYSGLSMYNPVTNKFWNYSPDEKKFIKSRVIKVMIAKDGSLWFITWNRLNTINLKTFKITSYLVDSLPAHQVEASIDNIAEDHENNFWFDSYHGLSFFNRKTHQVTLLDAHYNLGGFYDDNKGHAWLGGWQSSLREYDFNTKQFTDYFFNDKKDSAAVRNISYIEHIEKFGLQNLLWMGTEQGLSVFDIKAKKFIANYTHASTLTSQNSLPATGVGEVFFDGQNQLWIGTGSGLYTLNFNQLPIRTFYFPQYEMRDVFRVREDITNPSLLWVSVYLAGLFGINKYTGEIKNHFMPGKAKPYDELNDIQDFVQDSTGAIWCTSSNGIVKYFPKTSSYKFIPAPVNNLPGKKNDFYGFYLDDSVIWFGASAGIGKFNIYTNAYHYYFHYKNDSSNYFEAHWIRYCKKMYDGNIWGFTNNDGLLIFNPSTEKFLLKNVPGVDLTHHTIQHVLMQSADSTIWLDIGEQVLYKRYYDTIFHILFNPELDSWMYRIVSDSHNNLFIGMQTGLLEYVKQTGTFIRFTTKDGLTDNLVPAFDMGSNDMLFIRGTGSITIVDTKKLSKQYYNATLVLESFNINSKDTAINFDAYKNKSVTLNYKQNQLAFHFRLLNLSDASQTKYMYKLDGWDNDWISSSTGNYAAYSNLNGGDYVFHVKAINPDGTVNKQEAIMMIHIDKPFWRTWWFYILFALAATGLLYFIYSLRMQRLLAVEKIRSKISRDLHDDVGSTLTSINIWSDVAGRQLETDTVKSSEYIHRIRNSSQNMLDNMNDIIWAINPINDTLEKVLIRMKLYASEMLEPKDIRFVFNVDDSIKSTIIPMQYRRELYLIFKEAINNAAKYSSAKCVEVNIQLQHHDFLVVIKDDGKGFVADNNNPGNGLRNMKHRAEQMNAKLEIKSSAGNGTEITMKQRIT